MTVGLAPPTRDPPESVEVSSARPTQEASSRCSGRPPASQIRRWRQCDSADCAIRWGGHRCRDSSGRNNDLGFRPQDTATRAGRSGASCRHRQAASVTCGGQTSVIRGSKSRSDVGRALQRAELRRLAAHRRAVNRLGDAGDLDNGTRHVDLVDERWPLAVVGLWPPLTSPLPGRAGPTSSRLATRSAATS